MSRAFFLIVALAVVAAAATFGYFRYLDVLDERAEQREREEGPVPVVVAEVHLDDFSDRIEALGTAQSNEAVAITAKVTETVRRVAFTDGQIVQAGDILVELTDEEEGAELDQARASLREAEQQLERTKELIRTGNATQSRLDTAVSSRDQAQARVRAIEARLADRLIRAPFAGMLGLRQVSPGTLVTPGTVITTLDDIDPMKLDFSIPETFFAVVKAGQRIEARADAYEGEVFTGEITVVDTRIDPVTRAVLVRSQIPNPDLRLRPGMLMRVEIVKNERRAMSIPEDALVPLDTRVFVYRVSADNKAERVQIQVGVRRRGSVEVLSGLEIGDRIVVGGTNRVRPDGEVRVVEEQQAPGPGA